MLDVPDIVKYITFKGLQWGGHIERMDNARISKQILAGKFY